MPQIQMLPEQQSPLQALTPYINQAVGQLTQGYTAGAMNRKDQSILQQLQNAQSPMEQVSLVGQLSPERAKAIGTMLGKPLIQQSINGQQKLSPATTQYVKDIDKASAPAQSVLSSANRLMELADNTGWRGYQSGLPGPLVPADIAEFESTTNDLLSYYKAMFPRGITQEEFKILKKEALPNPRLSPEANKARIQRFIDKAQHLVDKQQKLTQYQEQYGFVPENIRELIEKEPVKSSENELKSTSSIPESEKKAETFSRLPNAKEHEGKTIKDKQSGKRYKATAGKWQEIK